MAPTDPLQHRSRPLGRLAIALSLIVGGAQLAYFLVYPSISQEGATDEWVFDLAYLVAVVLSLAGWAGVLVWSAVSLRPGSPTGPRLLPQMSLGAAVPSLGLLLGLFVLVVAISVGDDSAWLAVFAQGASSAVLVALAYSLRKESPQSPR